MRGPGRLGTVQGEMQLPAWYVEPVSDGVRYVDRPSARVYLSADPFGRYP